MEQHGPEIIAALALAGILALFRIAFMVQRLDQAVRGVNGDNGLVGDVRLLKASKHRIDDNAHTLAAAIVLTRSEVSLQPIPLKLRSEGE
jgi:hypothetical protein